MSLLTFLFDTASYPQRWSCGYWTPWMGWTHIVSDLVIFLAYMGIPAIILYFKKHFKHLHFNFIFLLFSAFIFFCGITHLNEAIIFWYPFYNFAGLIKLFTAIASFLTFIIIYIKLPTIIKMVNEKQSSAILRNIIDACPQGILIVNKKGIIVFANNHAQDLFVSGGTSLEGIEIESLLPNDFRQDHIELRNKHFNRPPNKQAVTGRDIHAQTLEGKIFPAEVGLNPVTFNNEECILCSVSDISQRKERELELKRLNSALETSNQELKDFTYIASHDLKEPLRGIHNYSMMVLEECEQKLEEPVLKKLKALPVLTQRLESHIDSLLEYSRLGQDKFDLKPVNLASIIHETYESIKIGFKDKEIELEIKEPIPLVLGYETRLKELFMNLISNAIKYNLSDTVRLEFGLVSGNYIKNNTLANDVQVFYFKDNGIGMRPEHLEKIFTIFKRLHAKDKYGGGSGVGLTIVKKIIEKHGGTIWADSSPGEGTTFFFTLSAITEGEQIA